jgi:hypothetical protein
VGDSLYEQPDRKPLPNGKFNTMWTPSHTCTVADLLASRRSVALSAAASSSESLSLIYDSVVPSARTSLNWYIGIARLTLYPTSNAARSALNCYTDVC